MSTHSERTVGQGVRTFGKAALLERINRRRGEDMEEGGISSVEWP